jgi:ATP-dependent RNA helicase DDX43
MSFNNHLEDEDKPYKKKKERDMEILRTMMENKARFDKEKADDSDQSDASSIIDWDDIDESGAGGKSSLWADHPPVEKLFYNEKAHISKMTKEEVNTWRQENHEMKVDYVPKNKETAPPVQIPNPCLSFDDAFSEHPEILKTIQKQGFEKPSPIQSQFWPCVLKGHDTIGIAQTGTGKTLAFLMPMFIHIDKQRTERKDRKGPTALILSPTRELAIQIEAEISKYTYKNIKSVCVYGGADSKSQISKIRAGAEIVVATPGRFNDLVNQKYIDLMYVSYVVLDEADRMLDMGFEPQILKIFLDIRPDRMTLMTSATWPDGVQRLCNTYLNDPIRVIVGSLDLAAVHTVTQYIKIVEDHDKEKLLYYYINKMKADDKYIIFCGRKNTVDELASNLCMKDIIADSIHGGRDQDAREQALKDFRKGETKVLIATDVASRGIDVNDISVVINYDMPRNMEEYVHRVGRTGRAGRKGRAVSFYTRKDWSCAKELVDILVKTNQKIRISW